MIRLLMRLMLALYLIASAMTKFDRTNLALWEVVLRLAFAD